MKRIAPIFIIIMAAAFPPSAQGGSADNSESFQSLAFADSAFEKDPEDTACCDKPLLLTEGKVLVPQGAAGAASENIPRGRALSPTGTLFLSLAIPGGGQVYNGQYIKAILYGGTEVYLIKYVAWRWKWMNRYQSDFQNSDDDEYKARQFASYEKMRDSRNLHMWLTGLVVFLSIFDAYVDAHLREFDQTDKAFEVYLAPDDDKIQLNLVYNF